jgi:nitroreductase/uncharacterized membrane protein YhaH (DUF805 family)
MESIRSIRPDVKLSHGQGVKAFWKDIVNFKNGATKQEFIHGLVFALYMNFILILLAFLTFTFPLVFMSILAPSVGSGDVFSYASLSSFVLLSIAGIYVISLALAFIALQLAMLSLMIRRLKSGGKKNDWAPLVLASAYFFVLIPAIGLFFSLVAFIVVIVTCLTDPRDAGLSEPESTLSTNILSGESSTSDTPSGVQVGGASSHQSFLDVIASRHTTREFLPEPLPREDLEKIALAGAQAPSSMNRQPWKITVVSEPGLMADLNAAAVDKINADEEFERFRDSIKKRGGSVFYGAPHIIFVSRKSGIDPKALDSAARDTGIVIENMALAATSLGYGNCICGLAELPFKTTRVDEFMSRIGIEEGYEFGIALLVGKSSSTGSPHETNLDKITWVE